MKPARARLARALVVGRGKVGLSFERAMRRAGIVVRAVPARSLDTSSAFGGVDLAILATRDADLQRVAALVAASRRPPRAALHCSGAAGVEALQPLRDRGVAIGSAHPLLSFAAPLAARQLEGGALVVSGDALAVRLGRELGRRLKMAPIIVGSIDRVRYHACAALVANGAAALAAVGGEILESLGLGDGQAARMLGPLLRSVAWNIERLGPEAALSGPVRRADVEIVRRHLETLTAFRLEVGELYRMLVQVQIPIAAALATDGSVDLRGLEALVGLR